MKDNVIKVPMIDIISSNVNQIGHHAKKQILAVRMNNNHLYYYLDIPRLHYDGLLRCNENITGEIKSIGSYLHRYIKGNFRYTRVE